jgi:hypothetical protein
MSTPVTPVFDLGTALGDAAAQVTAQVGDALPVALPVGGGIIALFLGWRIFKRFVRG